MSSPLVSIVVPVYNVEMFLSECLDSIMVQTYTNWECLIVDDGSKDSSGVICDEYASKDSRFKVFHKENGGVSSARNLGIINCKGEFICFVDSDDTIYNKYLDILFASIQNSDADSSACGYRLYKADNDYVDVCFPTCITNFDEEINAFYVKYGVDSQRYMVTRLFRTCIIKQNHIFFREDIFYKEDGLFFIEYLCKSNGKVAHNDTALYKYLQNPNSAMGIAKRGGNSRIFTNVTAHKLIVSQIDSCASPKSVALAKCYAKSSYLWMIKTMGGYRKLKIKDFLFLESEIRETIGLRNYLFWGIYRLLRFAK